MRTSAGADRILNKRFGGSSADGCSGGASADGCSGGGSADGCSGGGRADGCSGGGSADGCSGGGSADGCSDHEVHSPREISTALTFKTIIGIKASDNNHCKPLWIVRHLRAHANSVSPPQHPPQGAATYNVTQTTGDI